MVITIITVNSIIKYLKLPYQKDSCSPDNGTFNVVGVKVEEDPEDGYEDNQVKHNGQRQELTSESHVKDAFFSQEVLV